MKKAFSYCDGSLHAENVSLAAIAAAIGTPFYCYSTAKLQQNYAEFATPFEKVKARVYYAIKANPNLAVIRTLAALGAGADITSAGELERALHAGVRPSMIVYSGVGKRTDEITAALLAGIHQINVESIAELPVVNALALELDLKAPITLRVNPDVDARTIKKISTGELGTKFGIDAAQIDEALHLATTLPGLSFKGFTVHIGSHLRDFEPFRQGYGKLADLARRCRSQGLDIQRLDLGGGVGIPYDGQRLAPFVDYVIAVMDTVGDLGCELSFEPGRRLVGDAGVLVSRVLFDKQGAARRFLVLDAGMNDLVRPAMYDARHSIIALRENTQKTSMPADVVGPVCETSDLFGKDYELPGIGQGDYVAILQAGAYGASMSSTYNSRALIPEVLVSGDRYAVVRRRIAVAEQLSWEGTPPWIGEKPSESLKTS